MTTAPEKPKKNGCLTGCGTLIIMFIVVGIFGSVLSSLNKKNLTPEQKALEAKEQADDWYNIRSRFSCERELKNDLREPNSYERMSDFITTIPNKPNTKIVSWKFRAKNGFGGYTVGAGVCTISREDGGTFDVRIVNQ